MSSIAKPFRCALVGGTKTLVLVFPLSLLLLAFPVSAQQLEAVLAEGQPTLKYTDKNGCQSPINFGKIAGQEEAVTTQIPTSRRKR